MPTPTDTLTAGPGDIVAVTTWMPAQLAPQFQLKAAELLSALSGAAALDGAYVPPFGSTHGPANAWELAFWTDPEDRPAASWILADLNSKQRHVIAMLAANPAGVWTNDLREECGFTGKMSGTFKALGGRFRRCDRRPMWNGGDKGTKGQLLTVKHEGALAIFVAVLAEEYPDLAAQVGLA